MRWESRLWLGIFVLNAAFLVADGINYALGNEVPLWRTIVSAVGATAAFTAHRMAQAERERTRG